MANQPDSSRRDFLSGRAAGRAAADAVERAIDRAAEGVGQWADQLAPAEPAEAQRQPAGYVVTYQRRAMACNFEIRVNAGTEDQENHSAAAMAALDLIEQLEAQLTVYRETSELIEINRHAAEAWVRVELRLFEVLAYADELYRATGGAFDLTGGPLSRAWGFFQRRPRMPEDDELAAARGQVGWHKVQLDDDRQRIRFRQPGVEINVNSLGKGYALDRAAAVLAERGASDFLFHGGRSTLLARGDRAGQRGWLAGLRHPLRPQQRIAEFRLMNQALSTSGSATQSFRYRGQRYGHLIDPRTGWPAAGLYSATVIAPTAMEADALSTAFYIMGPEAAAAFCTDRQDIQALLILPTKSEGEIEVRSIHCDNPDSSLSGIQ